MFGEGGEERRECWHTHTHTTPSPPKAHGSETLTKVSDLGTNAPLSSRHSSQPSINTLQSATGEPLTPIYTPQSVNPRLNGLTSKPPYWWYHRLNKEISVTMLCYHCNSCLSGRREMGFFTCGRWWGDLMWFNAFWSLQLAQSMFCGLKYAVNTSFNNCYSYNLFIICLFFLKIYVWDVNNVLIVHWHMCLANVPGI